jgi:hypothetical protein
MIYRRFTAEFIIESCGFSEAISFTQTTTTTICTLNLPIERYNTVIIIIIRKTLLLCSTNSKENYTSFAAEECLTVKSNFCLRQRLPALWNQGRD